MSGLGVDGPLPPPGRIRLLSVFGLYRARLRARWLQELLAVVGIAIGVALLFASQVASTSLSGPVRQLNDGIVGNSQLQMVSRAPAGLPMRDALTVRRLPGVKIAAPVLQVQANLVGPKGSRSVTAFGADPRIVVLRGKLLRGFSLKDASSSQSVLAVPAPIAKAIGIKVGDDARLQVNGRTVSAPIASIARDQIGGIADTSIALAPVVYLQRLAGLPGRASRILVQVEPGQVDAVRARLERMSGGRFDVRPVDYEPRLFDVAAAPTSQATTISSAVSALVGFLFAFCAILVTAGSRRALAVDLRLDGYAPWQVIRILLVDVLALGVVAVVVGLGLGELLSRQDYGSSVEFLGGAFPLGNVRIVGWSSVAIAAAGGLLAAALGVFAPVRRVVFARVPQRVSAPVVGGSGRIAALVPFTGLALLVVAVAITVAAPGAALVGLVALALALVLLLPSALAATVAAIAWLSRRRDRAVMAVEIALPSLRSSEWRARSLAIATTGAIAVFGAVALGGARNNLQAGLTDVSVQLNGAADLWVTPFGSGDLLATTPVVPLPPRTLERVSGVASVAPYRSTFLDLADRRAWVLAPPVAGTPPVPSSQILDGRAELTTSRLRGSGWATLSRALSDELHLRVGDRFTLPAPVPMALRVAAITTNLGWSGGAVVMSGDDYARAWAGNAVSGYDVRVTPGASPARVRQAIVAALGPNSAFRVETASQRSLRQQDSARSGLSRLSQIASLTLVAAVLAMAAAMAGLLWQRRPTVSREKLDGHGTGRMWRALAIESGALFGTGCLAGAVFALLGQVLLSRGLATISGFPVVSSVQVGVAVASFALVVAVALAVVAVPGYLVARVRPSLRTGD